MDAYLDADPNLCADIFNRYHEACFLVLVFSKQLLAAEKLKTL